MKIDSPQILVGGLTADDSLALTDYALTVEDPAGTPVLKKTLWSTVKALFGLPASTATNDFLVGGADGAWDKKTLAETRVILDVHNQIVATTEDFDSAADTTLNDITGLSHTLLAGGKYHFSAYLFITNDVAGGTKIAVSGTCTATVIRYRTEFLGAAYESVPSTALDEAEGETAAHFAVRIDGYIEVADAGTLTIQAAQNNSNATATSVKIGSWFQVDTI